MTLLSAIRNRSDALIAVVLAVLVSCALLIGEKSVGFVRDEGIYFESGRRYAAWYLDDIPALGLEAFGDKVISSRFATNREHPALMKSLFGLSKRLFADRFHLVREATGFRLPAIFLSGLFAAAIFLFGRRVTSRRGALFAALAFWLIPRTFFHGVLSCFDMPIAFAWFLTAACYGRAVGAVGGETSGESKEPLLSLKWSLFTGLAFGFALSIKHNAWIIPGVLLIHWLLSVLPASLRRGGARSALKMLIPFGAMLILGPLCLFLTWPYLWHHPIERFGWYADFHAQHINYPWEYFGALLMDPPFPVGYALGLTAVTVPAALCVLMLTGFGADAARFADTYVVQPIRRRFRPENDVGAAALKPLDSATLLLLGNAGASLFVFSMPFIPIFGGVKHWLPAMPFLCLFAARALERISEMLAEPLTKAFTPRLASLSAVNVQRAAFSLLALFAFVPALIGLVHIHPYGTSFYNELAGGLPGAASLGMHRQYWSNNVTGVLPWINAHARKGARVYLHEVTGSGFRDYQVNGMLRRDLKAAGGPERADIVAYQYMPEFRDTEFQTWNILRTMTPVSGLWLDETPQVVVYERR